MQCFVRLYPGKFPAIRERLSLLVDDKETAFLHKIKLLISDNPLEKILNELMFILNDDRYFYQTLKENNITNMNQQSRISYSDNNTVFFSRSSTPLTRRNIFRDVDQDENIKNSNLGTS